MGRVRDSPRLKNRARDEMMGFGPGAVCRWREQYGGQSETAVSDSGVYLFSM